MTAFIVRRLLWLPVLLFAISIITFALGIYGPGDPVQVMLGSHTNPVIVEQIKKDFGFDQPFYIQYLNYVWNALHFNFGFSLVKHQGQPVSTLIAERLPVTLQLNLISIGWSVPLGVLLGVLAGVWRNSIFDLFARVLVIFGISLPIIMLLPLLTFTFSREHDISFLVFNIPLGPFLPVGGWDGILVANPDWSVFVQNFLNQPPNLPLLIAQNQGLLTAFGVLSALAHGILPILPSNKIVLPAFIEGLGPLAVFARQTRAGIIQEMGQDYVRTARMKGLRETMVVGRHALRNALLPLVTITGFMLGGLIEGSFLVENWYGIPGVGALAFESFFSREYYTILAFTILAAVVYTMANLFIDVAYAFVDPRIRYSES